MNAPKITLLSPGGRNAFGTSTKSKIVPARQTTQITGEIHRCRRNHQSDSPYKASTRFSMPPITRSIQVFFAPSPRGFNRRAHISGVSVSDTRPEAKIAITIVIANSRNILPTSPDMNTSGMKTAASEMVIDIIVKLISLALWRAASKGCSPRSSRRTVFSRNTIASSTRNPIASVSAINDKLSRLYPRARIAINVMSNESGSATVGISVSVARPKKAKITNTTRTKAMTRVVSTSTIECYDHCGRRHLIPSHPETHVDPLVLNRILYAGNIAQVHGRTTRTAKDQIAVLLGIFELTLRPENRSSGTAVQLPCSGVARSAFDRSAEIVNRNPSCPHRRRVGFNPNSRLGAVHVHLRNTGQDTEALADLRGRIIVELTRRNGVAGHRDVHDRLIVGIAF